MHAELARLQMGPHGLVEIAHFDTLDGLYDCAWSEENENILVSSCGDGSVKVWDLALPAQANPLRSLKEHSHEVRDSQWGLNIDAMCFSSTLSCKLA
eukprot:scaffold647901_cov35-Prasinocladus_malaysianus.AAC.4